MLDAPISKTQVQDACENALDNAITSPTLNSILDYVQKMAGQIAPITVTKSITHAGAGGSSTDLFTLVGNVRALEIYGT